MLHALRAEGPPRRFRHVSGLSFGQKLSYQPAVVWFVVLILVVEPSTAAAQSADSARTNVVRAQPGSANLDALLDAALRANPSIQAAGARLEAARRRLVAAGTRPDPMLMAGIENLSLGREAQAMTQGAPVRSGPEPMTMRVIGVSQTIPYPGKTRLRTQAAQQEVEASEAAVDVVRRMVIRDVPDLRFAVTPCAGSRM